MNICDLPWTYNTLIDLISSLPLKEFQLENVTADLRSKRLPGLRKISIFGRHRDLAWIPHILSSMAEMVANSPELTHLQIMSKCEDRTSLDDILSMVHRCSLTSLC